MTTHQTPAKRPPMNAARFLTDGGLETSLIFLNGLDLPEFAAYPLIDHEAGRNELTTYFDSYLKIADRDHAGFVIDTPTWRANADWGKILGHSRDELTVYNRRAVQFAQSIGERWGGVETIVNGVLGPRGDGYAVNTAMSPATSARYHSLQAAAFAAAGADMMTAVTMTYTNEAVGIARAARQEAMPVAIGFTVETDGRLPSGQELGAAIEQVDAETDGYVAWYMVNCAHPSHFAGALEADGEWLGRIQSVRANASTMSHEELDNAEELDRGIVAELATDYVSLEAALPNLRIVGGCCGTDHEHIDHISHALGGVR